MAKETKQERREILKSEFYSALGMAIAQWAAVEHSLYELYTKLIQTKNLISLSASYHVVIGFGTKLRMVDYAYKSQYPSYLYPDLYKEWKSLYTRIKKNSRKRNDIAHYMAIFECNEDLNINRLYLRPEIANVKAYMDKKEKNEYDVKRLRSMTPTFGRLSRDINNFRNSIPVI